MGNIPIMPLFQAFGWLLLLSFASGLLLWSRLSYAASKAPQRPETPKDPILSPQRRTLDTSYRSHVHEAGHIIAHWLNPYTHDIIGAVVFRDGSGFTGYTRGHPSGSAAISAAWYGTCTNLSGMAAEMIIYGKANPKKSEEDLRHARDRIEAVLAVGVQLMNTTPWLDTWHVGTSKPIIGALYHEPPSPEVALVLDKTYAHAKSLIAANQDRLRAIALAMKDGCGHISRAEIETIMGPRPRA